MSYSLISQVASGVFTALLTLYLVRALRPSGYGEFGLAVGVGTLVAVPADFGVASSAARFIAERLGNESGVAAVVADALRLKLIFSGVSCGLLVALAGPIAHAYHAPLTWPLRLIAIAVFAQSVMILFQYSFTAARRSSRNISIAFGESAVECGGSVLIVALGGGVVGAAGGRALGYSIGALLALKIGARAFAWPKSLRRRDRSSMMLRIARYAGPLMLVIAASSMFAMIDVLLIGAFLGPRQVGLFAAPTRLLTIIAYVGVAAASGIAPRLVRRSDGGLDSTSLIRGMRWLLLFHSLLLAPLVVWTKPIVDIALGAGYDGSITTLRWLSVAVYLEGIAPLVSISVNYLGDVRSRVPLMFAATLLNAVLDVILIPRIGIVSGAIATGAAFAVMVAGHIRICGRHMDMQLRQLAVTAARGLLAAASMVAVLLLIGTDPSVPVFIIGALLGATTFTLALIATRELRVRELADGWRWLRGRGAALRARA